MLLILGFGKLSIGFLTRVLIRELADCDIIPVFWVRKNEKWSHFLKYQSLVIHYKDNNDQIFHNQEIIIKKPKESAGSFKKRCREKNTAGLLITDFSEIALYKDHISCFATCSGNSFTDLINQIDSIYNPSEKYTVALFENNINEIVNFKMNYKHDNALITTSGIDCICSRVIYNKNSLDVKCEEGGILIADIIIDQAINRCLHISYNNFHNLIIPFDLSSTRFAIIKKLMLNIPYCLIPILNYSHANETKYKKILKYQNIYMNFLLIDKIENTLYNLKPLFAYFLINSENTGQASLSTYAFINDYFDFNLKRFHDNNADTVGRVLHLSSEKNYFIKIKQIVLCTKAVYMFFAETEIRAPINEKNDMDKLLSVLKTIMSILDSIILE